MFTMYVPLPDKFICVRIALITAEVLTALCLSTAGSGQLSSIHWSGHGCPTSPCLDDQSWTRLTAH